MTYEERNVLAKSFRDTELMCYWCGKEAYGFEICVGCDRVTCHECWNPDDHTPYPQLICSILTRDAHDRI